MKRRDIHLATQRPKTLAIAAIFAGLVLLTLATVPMYSDRWIIRAAAYAGALYGLLATGTGSVYLCVQGMKKVVQITRSTTAVISKPVHYVRNKKSQARTAVKQH